jgi:hypothetical protein
VLAQVVGRRLEGVGVASVDRDVDALAGQRLGAGSTNSAPITRLLLRRSSMVSNSGTMLTSRPPPGRSRPTSLSSNATSSTSDTASALEMT